jgi:hypothetical protein
LVFLPKRYDLYSYANLNCMLTTRIDDNSCIRDLTSLPADRQVRTVARVPPVEKHMYK